MGMRGPAPTPTHLKIIRNNPGHRPINQDEPKPLETRPEMPAKVAANPRSAEEWGRLCPILERMRVLTEADYIALGNLCYDVGLLEDAQKKLSSTGLLIETKKTGMIRQNPLLGIVATTTDRVSRALREFGLTPASRSGIRVAQAQTDNEWAI